MNLAQEIITKLEKGIIPNDIKAQHNWSELPNHDREKLMELAEENIENPEGRTLLLTLIRLTEKNEWDFVRVLALVIQRRDSEIKEKSKALTYMRRYLDNISKQLSDDPTDIQRYLHYWGDYKILNAKVLEENGNLDLALQNYREAQNSYQEIGANDKVDEAERQIEKINVWKENKGSLIPLIVLQDERMRINQEIEDLQIRKNQFSEVLKVARAEVKILSEQKETLENEIVESNEEILGINGQLEELTGEIDQKETRVGELEKGLEFMVALPRLATGPLWVEVVRLALKQGEIDDLTINALERLSANGSKEARKLLSEISARLPEGMIIDHFQFESELDRWFSGIAKAKSLHEEDPYSAAQTMTETWESFIQFIGRDSTYE